MTINREFNDITAPYVYFKFANRFIVFHRIVTFKVFSDLSQ